MKLREYLVGQGLNNYVDEYDVLEAKYLSMRQHINHLEPRINDTRLDVAKRVMQGLMANPSIDVSLDTGNLADDLAEVATKLADTLLEKLANE